MLKAVYLLPFGVETVFFFDYEYVFIYYYWNFFL